MRAPIPPGRYRLALDLVAEFRAWFSELGSPMLAEDVEVLPRAGEPNVLLPAYVEPAPGWADVVRAAHAEATASSRARSTGTGRRFATGRASSSPYAPGPGRVPGFAAPLLCPSVLPGIELEPLEPIAGLPAFAAPSEEPWIYDGRADPQSSRPRSGRRRA